MLLGPRAYTVQSGERVIPGPHAFHKDLPRAYRVRESTLPITASSQLRLLPLPALFIGQHFCDCLVSRALAATGGVKVTAAWSPSSIGDRRLSLSHDPPDSAVRLFTGLRGTWGHWPCMVCEGTMLMVTLKGGGNPSKEGAEVHLGGRGRV